MNLLPADGRLFYRYALLILVAGLLVQGWLWQRQGILADQNAVLYYGTQFRTTDGLPAFAKPCSAGAQLPGFLLPALVGGALSVWPDYRSPTLLALVLHLAAYLLLAWLVRRTLEPGWALAYLALYWLSVWRLFHAASAWEPAFVLLPGAVHMVLCFRLRERAGFLDSTLLAWTVAVSFQLHASAMLLLLSTVLLWFGRKLKLHGAGVLAGSLLAVLMYVPTLRAMLAPGEASALPQTHQGLLLGLLSMIKGATFWLRMPTPDLGERFSQAASLDGGDPRTWLVVLRVLFTLLVIPSAWATWRLVRTPAESGRGEAMAWLRAYALACLASLLAGSLLSPASVQTWHVVIVLHAAILPLVLALRERGPLRKRSNGLVVAALIVCNLAAAGVLGLFHEQYRRPTAASLEALSAPDTVRALVPLSK